MQFGKLVFAPINEHPELTAQPVRKFIQAAALANAVSVCSIDPDLADTAAFCEAYGIPKESSANCIIIEAKRGDKVWHAACLVLATDMIDVNNKVRRFLAAKKASFAARETALKLTNMEYGGVTPIGLPDDMTLLIDKKIIAQDYVVIGSGIRGSKILASTATLTTLSNATVVDIRK